MTAQTYRTTDFDEASAIYQQVFYEARIEPVRDTERPFHMELTTDTAGPLTFAIASHTCETYSWAGGPDATYMVGVPLSGAFPFRFGRDVVVADQFTAAITTPADDLRFRGYRTRNDRIFGLSVDRCALEAQLRSLLGRDRLGTIKLARSLDLRRGYGQQWWQLASTLAEDLQTPNGLMANPVMTADLSSAIITGLLLSADHSYRDKLDALVRPVAPATIRRAAAIIESRAHEPLTIPEVAAEIGCSVTALQAGYRKYLNMTPRDHLRRVRMDGAHSMLRSADPDSTTVADIAAHWGFRHASRFAAEYRKVYGVLPSVTLRDGD